MVTLRGRRGKPQRRRIWIAEITVPLNPSLSLDSEELEASPRVFYILEIERRQSAPIFRRNPGAEAGSLKDPSQAAEAYKAIECHRQDYAPLDGSVFLDLAEEIWTHRTTVVGPDKSQFYVRSFHKHSWEHPDNFIARILCAAGLEEWVMASTAITRPKTQVAI